MIQNSKTEWQVDNRKTMGGEKISDRTSREVKVKVKVKVSEVRFNSGK